MYTDQSKINIKIINKSNNDDPGYKRKGDSGFDLRAYVYDPIIIPPLERCLIHTGIYVELPEGYEIQVRPEVDSHLKME